MRLVFLLLLIAFSGFGAVIPNRRLNFQSVASSNCAGTNQLAVGLLTGFGNTSNGNVYATGSVTPSTNATLILFAATGPSADETVTNTGSTQLTWRRLGTTNYNVIGTPVNRLVAWGTQLAQGTAPFAMTVVLTIASGVGVNMHLIEVTGADQTLAFGTNAIVQTVGFGVDASANPTNKFAAPGNNGMNSLLLAVADDQNSASDNAATLNWTELLETSFNTTATGLATYYTNAASVLVTATNTATSRDWATMLIEVKAGTNCGGTSVIQDDFNRGDSADLGTTWTTTTSEQNMQLLSNSAQNASAGSDCSEFYSGKTWGPNQSSEAAITVVGTDATTGAGVMVRCSSTARTYYRAVINQDGEWETCRVSAGTKTSLATGTATYSAGAVLKLSIVGTTLVTTYNGTQLDSRTDSNIAAGSPGVAHAALVTSCNIDNWVGREP